MTTYINPYNRNRHRRIYGYAGESIPPEEITVDVHGDGTVYQTFDRNSISIHRDSYIIFRADADGDITVPVYYSIYEEDVLTFKDEVQKTQMFGLGFQERPIVVLDVISSDADIQCTLGSISETGIVVNTSALFTGVIRYRAVSIHTPSPTVNVERLPYSPGNFYNISIGSTLLSGIDTFSTGYTPLGVTATDFVVSTVDSQDTHDAMVSLISGSINDISHVIEGRFSANVNNTVNYAVFASV